MKHLRSIFIFLFITSITIYAGGTASLVAKKSSTKGFSYSRSTRLAFIQECSENANQDICYCVLDKIQQQYSEKQYLKLDADLRKNINRPDFVAFISKAADTCDARYAENSANNNTQSTILSENQSSKLTKEEAKEYANVFFKEVSKNDFVKACSSESKDFYGEKTAFKVCDCAYSHMASDIPRFTQMLMDNGYPDDSDTSNWGKEYMYECAPEKFTPEMKEIFINRLNKSGIPMSMCICVTEFISKEYTLQSFISASQNKTFDPFFKDLILKCQLEMELNNYHSNTTLESHYSQNEFNEAFPKGNSEGIGDGLAGFLGGGIATKAKGSIKTPSMRDIDMDTGGSRSEADIMKVVRQRTPGLRHIYNKYLKKKSGFQGKVTLKFTIASSGEIISISIVSSTTGFNEFDNEIKESVSRWKFSQVQSGNTTVSIPFTFSE